MAVSPSQRTERALHLSQIEKIENSYTLHGSESLRKLLRYLAEHALERPGVAVKEYQIATEVFGRPAAFDPQSDSTIRVQAGRLRHKLVEYYATEGADDVLLVEMPKGAYLLSFHPRVPESSKMHGQNGHGFPAEKTGARRVSQLWPVAVACLAVLLLGAVVALSFLVAEREKSSAEAASRPVPPVFSTFWKPFVSSTEEPWVIFSNGAFVGRPETGMRYFDPARDRKPKVILDHYTGVGEVLAVHDLDRVFNLLHRQVRVKRGSLFSLDDARNNDLIFVGSPAENLSLEDIPGSTEFAFQRSDSGERKGDLAITNLRPQAGELKYFFGSPSNTPLTEDYSLVALVKGLDRERSVLILAGTTTLGTEAAVEFVCDENSLRQLFHKLNANESGPVRPFEAVLHVKVTRGVPVETNIVAFRTR